MQNKHKYKVIILGFGPTGLYATYYCCVKKLDCLVLEINSTYGGAPARLFPDKALYDIPGHIEISGAELVENMYKQVCSMQGYEIKYNTNIIEIIKLDNSDARYKLIDDKGDEYFTDNIVFSTGYGAFEFASFDCPINQNAHDKIHYFVKDSKLYNGKKVIICGGGDSAVDFANKLKETCKLSLIHRRNQFKAHPSNVDKLLQAKNINIYLNKKIDLVSDKAIKIIDNETNECKELEYDYIIVQYGTNVIPNKIKIENLFNRIYKISVDQNLESINYPGIYACGLATDIKQEQTIITGISDAIKVISKISKEK